MMLYQSGLSFEVLILRFKLFSGQASMPSNPAFIRRRQKAFKKLKSENEKGITQKPQFSNKKSIT